MSWIRGRAVDRASWAREHADVVDLALTECASAFGVHLSHLAPADRALARKRVEDMGYATSSSSSRSLAVHSRGSLASRSPSAERSAERSAARSAPAGSIRAAGSSRARSQM